MAKPKPTTVTITATEDGPFLVAALLSEDQLKGLVDLFEPLSRSWRGQYQSMAKAIVDAAKEATIPATGSG